MTHAIETSGLTKRFGETRALDGVDLQIRQGTVYGLLAGRAPRGRLGARILLRSLVALNHRGHARQDA